MLVTYHMRKKYERHHGAYSRPWVLDKLNACMDSRHLFVVVNRLCVSVYLLLYEYLTHSLYHTRKYVS